MTSRSGGLALNWADGAGPGDEGKYFFRLPIGQLRELQEKCNAGPQEIAKRLMTGTWRVDDMRETIRLGLIGGGIKPPDANKLVQRYVDDRPLLESVQVAHAVIFAALAGPPDEPPKKEKPAGDLTEPAPATTTTAEDSSPSADSTPPASLSG